MQAYDSVEATVFGPSIRRAAPRRRPAWDSILPALAVVSALLMTVFAVYELDRYWSAGQSYGPTILGSGWR